MQIVGCDLHTLYQQIAMFRRSCPTSLPWRCVGRWAWRDDYAAELPRKYGDCESSGSVGDGEVFFRVFGGGGFVEGDFFPIGIVAQNAGDDSGVHGVSGAVGFDVAEDALAEEGEVADEVEDLVADEFVREAQRRVVDAVVGEHDAVLTRRAAYESHVEHGALLLEEAEGARGRNLFDIGAVGELDAQSLAADERMREIDGVTDGVAVGRIYGDELVAFTQFVRAQDLEVGALAALLTETNAGDHLDEGLRAAVENGKLEIVELDDGVVDAHANEGGEKVLGGGDEHAFLHERSGVADLGDVAADGCDFEAIEVGAAENNARVGRGGKDAEMDGSTAVESDAATFDGVSNCAFEEQEDRLKSGHTTAYRLDGKVACGICATSGGDGGTCMRNRRWRYGHASYWECGNCAGRWCASPRRGWRVSKWEMEELRFVGGGSSLRMKEMGVGTEQLKPRPFKLRGLLAY